MINTLTINKKSSLLLKIAIGVIPILTTLLLLPYGNFAKLAAYLLYMSVACTFIPLPTPPYVIAMGELFPPWLVALTGAGGNCIAAFIEYFVIIGLLGKVEIGKKIESNKIYQTFCHIFKKSAFLCLIFTGFTPIPFEPFRLSAIFSRYSIYKYISAIFIGRFPRYYIIAFIGSTYKIPDYVLIIMFVIMITIPLLKTIIKKPIQEEKDE